MRYTALINDKDNLNHLVVEANTKKEVRQIIKESLPGVKVLAVYKGTAIVKK